MWKLNEKQVDYSCHSSILYFRVTGSSLGQSKGYSVENISLFSRVDKLKKPKLLPPLNSL